jgi:hypothetical protein
MTEPEAAGSHWGEVQNVAMMEPREFPGTPEPVMHVTGLIQFRDCGCYAAVGVRLDDMEPTFGVWACGDDHEPIVRRTLLDYGAIKDSDADVLELWRQMLDAAIG